MLPLRDFVATLPRARKSFKDIQETVVAAYGDRSLKKLEFTPSSKSEGGQADHRPAEVEQQAKDPESGVYRRRCRRHRKG
jgi:hypothetical protein